ncbi:MAG: hypothetical protein AB7I37_26625, partial [Pirellulales bacterium]
DDYLELLDWTSRQMRPGKASLPAEPPAALSRLGISIHSWLPLATRFGKLFQRVAGGPPSMTRLRQRSRVRFHCRESNLLATG